MSFIPSFYYVIPLHIAVTLGCQTGDEAWNTNADGHTCGARITWLMSEQLRSLQQAKLDVSEEFPEECGACADLSCEDVANADAGGFTCRARILWLQNVGKIAERDAAAQVASEFPAECGPCGERAADCESVWDVIANGHTCGDRIEWLVTSAGLSHDAAKQQVSAEYSECSPCGSVDEDSVRDDEEHLPAPPAAGGQADLSVVTQNLFWWNLMNQRGGGSFFDVFPGFGPFDVMMFQECDNVWQVRDRLGLSETHDVYSGAHAVALAWDRRRFSRIAEGANTVGEDKPGLWGDRVVSWVMLKESNTQKTYWVGSHHGPLPINTGGSTGSEQVARNIAEVIESSQADFVILGGDFNADKNSITVRTLVDLTGMTLHESDWVDHVVSRGLMGVPETKILRGTGSDHNGIKVTWTSGISGE